MFCIYWCLSVVISASVAMPLAKRMVDMTYIFDETTKNFPVIKPYEMKIQMNWSMNDEITWLQYEEFSMGTHVGTHMDAPSDFIRGGKNMEKIPIQQMIAPAAVINITQKAKENPDANLAIEDLLRWESVTGHSLDGTIVFIKSGWGRYWSNETAFFGNADKDFQNLHYPGLAPEAAQWLVENRKILGVGSETLSVDNGISTDFGAHIHLLGAEVIILENVANVDQLPMYGATVYALPMKLGKSSGAPTRLIATYPEVIFDPPEII